MSDREQLLSFGFSPERVDRALKATGGRGLQPALQFLEDDNKRIPSGQGSSQEQKAQSSTTEEKAPRSKGLREGVRGVVHPNTRLEIRLSTGEPSLSVTLPSTNTLRSVAEYVAEQYPDYDVDSITFMMQFPRKTYSRSDREKTLLGLGFTPSSVLIAMP
ncbi:hypothetical protein FRB94_009270 [Tulasnella sp. JGI-2019a]|nr:hypothetical protein FRB94_009270 [Tulasnella sp. JGI-2019a]KAG9016527.1 hypothetical protein FRB93_010776 [Tulasnella sp. JGI-2019a]KAG9031233.1 hypothetical protein FRB95_002935 [Tulasnella sp. JGI-2019a]